MKGCKQHTDRRHRDGGFSLLEVLIALVILSIGLLGLAGLQAYGLKSNHGAYLRSQATVLTYEIIDNMRANRPRAIAGDYNIDLAETNLAGTSVAADDVNDWKSALAGTLPAGNGSILVNNGIVTVTVRWDEARIVEDEDEDATDTTAELVTRTRL